MRQASWAVAAILCSGCVEEDVLRRPDPVPGVEISTREASPVCRPVQPVEVRSGHHDPTTHELLRAFAAEHGANYVVLDAFTVVSSSEDIVAITFARLFQCPIELFCYRCPPADQRALADAQARALPDR